MPSFAALVMLIAVVGIALVWGGMAEVGTVSSSYRASAERSFVAQGRIVALQSNRSAGEMRSLIGDLGSTQLGRVALEERLDGLVGATASQSRQAALALPAAVAVAGHKFVNAMALRARAVVVFRSAIDGLLGMTPSTPVGAYIASGGQHSTSQGGSAIASVLVPSGAATAMMLSAGSMLMRSDRDYALARKLLSSGGATTRLPVSRWVVNPADWGIGPVSTLVQEVEVSPSLSARHALSLTAVRVDPSAVPPLLTPQTSSSTGSQTPTISSTTPGSSVVTGNGGSAVIPPTSTLSVTAVVGNNGNVSEVGVLVTVTLQRTGTSGSSVKRQILSLEPNASMAVAFAPFGVSAGSSYTLTVSVSSSDVQQGGSGLTQVFSLQIAPATPLFPTGPG